MKINENLYYCPWCETEVKYTKKKAVGKDAVSNTLTCLVCGRYISQK